MNHRRLTIINGFAFALLAASALTWASVTSAAPPPPAISTAESDKPASYDVAVRSDIRVAMRDGVELSTYIFLPKAPSEKFPVILLRTPYGKGAPFSSNASKKLASRGYVVVVQYCRGRGESDGEWEPMVNEMADGLDTHQWLLAQPWCNGKIGTNGGSYSGFTQWVTAPGAGDYLKGMFATVPLFDWYKDCAYIGGTFNLEKMMMWGVGNSVRPEGADVAKPDWDKAFRQLPLSTWDRAIGYEVPFLRDWIAHPQFDDYWAKSSIRDRWNKITCPTVTVSGWYDVFLKQALDHVAAVKTLSASKQVRRHQYLIVGPWPHYFGLRGDVDFGPQASINTAALQDKWYDYWLKGRQTGVDKWAPVRIFVMGRNQWRNEQEWPLGRTRYTPYYFHSQGSANTVDGDGELSTARPSREPTDRYEYDPQNPVPTLGGPNYNPVITGPRDQRKAEERSDVLVFTSKKLEEEVEVTGPVKVILFAASTAPDTDWTAKLVDVHPDGRSINLCDGITRARYRESAAKPTLIKPGEVYRYEIDLWATSNAFLPGHCIRVEISSSNFPRFDRNPNTGHPFGKDAELNKARQTVYHDNQHASQVLLPIIPR